MNTRRILSASIASLLLITTAALRAQTWDGGDVDDNNWSSGDNWVGNIAPLNDGTASIVFGGAVRLTPNVDLPWSVNSLFFNNSAGAFVIGGSQLTVGVNGISSGDGDTQTINNAIVLGASQQWFVANTAPASGALLFGGSVNLGANTLTINPTLAGHNITLNGAVSGTGAITKNGVGTMTLGGAAANTFTGVTTVNTGTLLLNKTAGTDTIARDLVIGDGAGGANADVVRLLANDQINDTTISNNITINSSGLLDLNGFNEGVRLVTLNGGNLATGTGTLTFTGVSNSVVVTASSASATISGNLNLNNQGRFFDVADSVGVPIDLNVTAVLSNGAVLKLGAGTLRLSAASPFTGGVTLNAGTLIVANNAALGTGLMFLSGGTIQAEGTRTLTNASQLTADFTVAGGVSDSLTITGASVITTSNRTITTNAALTTTFSGVIGQTGGVRSLTKAGTGALRLSGNNTFSGGLIVNAGTLQFGNNGAAGTGTLTLGGGAIQADGGARTLANSVVLSADTSIGGTDDLSLNGGTTITGGNRTVTVTGTGIFSMAGVVGQDIGGRSLIKAGTGTLRLGGSNTFSGGFTVNAGTAAFGNNGAAGTGTLTLAGGAIQADGGARALANTVVLSGDTTIGGTDNLTLNGGVTITGGNRTLSVQGTGTFDLAGVVGQDIAGRSLIKSGTGLLRLSGNNTFTGGLTVSAGTLAIGHNNAAGTGTLTLSGGTIQADGASRILSNAVSITGNPTIGGTGVGLTFTGPVTLATTTTIGVNTTVVSLVFDTAIGEDTPGRGITKIGPQNLHFSGSSSNTYTGVTTVNEGALDLAKTAATAIAGDLVIGDGIGSDVAIHFGSDQIADTSNVTINSSGVLDLGSHTDSIGSLTMTGGAIGGLGTLTLLGSLTTNAGSNSAVIDSALNLGGAVRTFSVADGGATNDLDIVRVVSNGGITKTGAGLLRLGGSVANTYTGTTTVNDGTLALARTVANGAITGPLVIGDSSGTDIVRLDAENQIADSVVPAINSAGQLNLNGFNETVAGLTMTGGAVTTGAGTLILGGNVATNAHTTAATIAGNLNLGGPTRTFTVADGPAATDLDVIAAVANGGFIKEGAGTLAINGTFASGVTLNAGTLAGTITNAAGGTYTQNGGTFAGSLTNQGTSNFNGGSFTGSLNNQAAATFNANFTAGAGIENAATLTVNSGVTLEANGSGLVNLGTLTLNNGTLAGSSATNDFGGQLNAKGTVSAPFTNNGTLDVTGLLTLGAASSNAGSVTIATTESLRANAAFSNTGVIELSGGSITGTGTVTNVAGGVIEGRGAVSAQMAANAGLIHATGLLTLSNLTSNVASGELRVDDGEQLNVVSAFTNTGFISLRGADAILAGGALANAGTLSGIGRVTNVITNTGTISASAGDLTLAGSVTNSASGRIVVNAGAQLLASSGLASNAGAMILSGGAFDNNGHPLASSGQISGFGALTTGNLTNTGQMTLTDDSSIFGDVSNATGGRIVTTAGVITTVYDEVVHNGIEIRTGTGGSSIFLGPVSGAGPFTGTGSVFFEGGYSPGNSPASVFLGSDIILGDTNTLTLEIGGLDAGSGYDQLVLGAGGALTLDGALVLNLIDGFVPHFGDTFQLLDFNPGQAGGSFDEVTIADTLPGDLAFDTSALSTTGKITVIPEPGIGALLVSMLTLGAFRRSNKRNQKPESRR